MALLVARGGPSIAGPPRHRRAGRDHRRALAPPRARAAMRNSCATRLASRAARWTSRRRSPSTSGISATRRICRTPPLKTRRRGAQERTQVLMDLANMCNGLCRRHGATCRKLRSAGPPSTETTCRCTASMRTCQRRCCSQHALHLFPARRRGAGPERVLTDDPRYPDQPRAAARQRRGHRPADRRDSVGPYELHDFFLYHAIRRGEAREKIQRLAEYTFAGSYDARKTIAHWAGYVLPPVFLPAVQAIVHCRTGRARATSLCRRAATGACRANGRVGRMAGSSIPGADRGRAQAPDVACSAQSATKHRHAVLCLCFKTRAKKQPAPASNTAALTNIQSHASVCLHVRAPQPGAYRKPDQPACVRAS